MRYEERFSKESVIFVLVFQQIEGKGKVIPLQARCGPEGGQSYSSTVP